MLFMGVVTSYLNFTNFIRYNLLSKNGFIGMSILSILLYREW